MSKEKFIKGKHDNGKHAGRYSNIRRELAAQALFEVWPELVNAVLCGTLETEDEFHPLKEFVDSQKGGE